MPQFDYAFLSHPKIISGACSLENIPAELAANNACKPLIITDRAADAKKLDRILIRAFDDSDCLIGAVFNRLGDYAGISLAWQAADLFVRRGCDALIALGSPLSADLARAINILVSENTPDLSAFFTGAALTKRLYPLVLVPAGDPDGTGAGNTLTLDNQHLYSEFLAPDVIVLDKRMLRGQLPHQTAQSAAITADNAWSAFTGTNPGPIRDAFVHTALRLLNQNIDAALASPGRDKPCLAMANAGVIAAIAAANAAPGIVRVVSEELARMTRIRQGVFTGLLAPAALERSMEQNGPPRPELLLAVAGMETYAATPEKQRPARGADMLKALLDKIQKNLGQSLESLQIPFYRIRQACENAESRPDAAIKASDALDLAGRAWKGAPE
ncbi:MAG: iron-containing alcohol dehydrogenase [Desulfobacterales bacterium]|nr:iron-containing alcohol dehydrogenase [Desulfobacterales bacterium]